MQSARETVRAAAELLLEWLAFACITGALREAEYVRRCIELPGEPYQRAVARLWMKKVDDYFHGACATLTFAIAFRPSLLKKTPEELETRFAAIPDPAMRERQRQAVVLGLEAPDGLLALQNYERFVSEMEQTLARSLYLAGGSYSLADAAATPYIHRAEMLAMDRLWTGRRPHVADWYDRVRQRPSFEGGIARYIKMDRRLRAAVAKLGLFARACARRVRPGAVLPDWSAIDRKSRARPLATQTQQVCRC